ncbi:MAG: terminase large subunit [Lachnospiraceae bacterium]
MSLTNLPPISDSSYLVQYYTEIKEGRIIAGQELITCLENLIRDLKNPKYVYDLKAGHLQIDFIEKFCKQTRSPFFGKPLKLELWEKAFIEVLYSFKRADTGFRRFTKAILLIGRKNGKSTLCAALAFAQLMVGAGGSDIICSSNDDSQAGIIFEEIANMREAFDPKGKRTHKNLQGIFNKKRKSTVKKMSEKTQNKEGRNIDFAILDESHEMKDNRIAKPIEQSQSTKDEPLFINISTEGFVNDGYLDNELIDARKILNGEIEDEDTDSVLVWLYTQDSEEEIWTVTDEDIKAGRTAWHKSNPNLGVTKKYSYLKKELAKAKRSQKDRVYTLAKDFNIKQNNAAAWLMREDYDYECGFNLEDFSGSLCLGAADLAITTDLCCVRAMMMKPGDPVKYSISQYFIPEGKIERMPQDEQAQFRQWVADGYITQHPGNEVKLDQVADWFLHLLKKYKIKLYKGGYDDRFAKEFLRRMDDIGWSPGIKETDTWERIDQTRIALTNPMNLLEADLKDRLFYYNNNPVDKYCFGNVALDMDKDGLIKPTKVQDIKTRHIDGAAAAIDLYAIYQRYKSDFNKG